jgi:hypothetical protein
MKYRLIPNLNTALSAATNAHPAPVKTVREVLFKHIDGVKVVLQKTEMTFAEAAGRTSTKMQAHRDSFKLSPATSGSIGLAALARPY